MLRGFAQCFALLIACSVLGCQSGSERRAEVQSISAAIDRLRQVPNSDKAPMLELLSQLPCSLTDVCELRDRCVRAYRLQVEALDEIAALKQAPNVERVSGIDAKLEAARKLAHECLENELVVGRRYGTQK